MYSFKCKYSLNGLIYLLDILDKIGCGIINVNENKWDDEKLKLKIFKLIKWLKTSSL